MKLIVSIPVKALGNVGLNRKRRTAKLADELLIIAPGAPQGLFDRNRESPGFLPAAEILDAGNAGHAESFAEVRSEPSSRFIASGVEKREVDFLRIGLDEWEERCTLYSARHAAPGTWHAAS